MSKIIKVDFTGVESFQRCTEGEHVVKLVSYEEGTSQEGNDKISVKFEVVKGESAGARVYETFVLTEKALFKLKGYLEAVGIKADGKLKIDLDKLVGKVCIANIADDDYNGKIRSKIAFFKKLEAKATETDEDDEEEEEEEEEEVVAPPKKATKPAPTPPAKKEEKKSPPPKKATKPVVVDDYDDFEEDDDEEEWEED